MNEVLARLLEVQPAPDRWLVLAAGAVALVAVASRRLWPIARHAVTIAHEGGHALIALVTGRRLTGIRLHSDTSGLTVSRGRPTGPGMVLTLLAGYPAPSLLGLGGAALLVAGRTTVLLWTCALLLTGVLVMVRNPFGLLSTLLTGGTVLAVSWFAPVPVQGAFAHLATWFLLLAGVRPVIELQRARRRGGAPHSDADQLARLTRVPGLVWVALFAVVDLAALLLGGGWLLGAV